MDWFGQDQKFWIAVLAASLIKVLFSDTFGFLRSMVTVVAAVFSAWVFTAPVLEFMSLSPDVYEVPVAALLALSGEGLMRWVIGVTPEKILILLRGGKK